MQVRSGVRSFLFVTGTMVLGMLVGACSLLEPEDGNSVPEITLKGKAVDTIGIGHSYVDSGAVATDEEDGNLTSSITVTGSVDTSTEGAYTLTYSVTDSEGESASVTRTVHVVDNTISLGTLNCPAVFDCTTVSYKISSTLTIPEGCKVTFGPNTRVEMTDNIIVNGELIIKEAARFLVDEGAVVRVEKGTLTIEGSDTANVVFGNLSPGSYWGRGGDDSYWYSRFGVIVAKSANVKTSIAYCTFDSATVGLYVKRDGISITHSTFTNCAYAGIYFDDCGPADSASFVGNALSGNGKTATFFPIYIDATYLSRLSGTTVFSDNAVDAVAVEGETVTESGSWRKLDVPYVFRRESKIDNTDGVTITVRPGVRFAFLQETYLSVNHGTLIAEGTADDSISFSNFEDGKYWGSGGDDSYWYSRFGLKFTDNANANSSLKYCTFDSATVGVYVARDAISISDCRFDRCAYAGLYFENSGPADSASFLNNAFSNNGKSKSYFPMYIDATYLSRLSGTATFENNAVDAVAVEGEAVTESGSWKKLTVPYVFRDGSTVDNPDGVVVTIRPGARFEFLEGTNISIDNATLIAEGTGQDSIRFSNFEGGKYWGSGNDDSYWYSRYGLKFTENANANSSLKYCVFDSATVGLYVDKDGIGISHCRFTRCAHAGIYFENAGPADSASFLNNAFVENGKTTSYFPVYIDATYLSRLSGTASFTGNTVDAVAVLGEAVTETGTWRKLDVPYVFSRYATIDNTAGVVITVEPGTRFQFLDDTYLEVQNGTFIAEGTSGDSISFSNYLSGKYWGKGDADSYMYGTYGVKFSDGANANSSLKYCSFDSATVAVNIDEIPVNVSHCSISNTLTHGIYSYGAGSNANIDGSTITFSNIGKAPNHFHEE